MSEKRSQWGSKIGFILAAAGSAVGLGNIWKFPYITGENGGGLFVLIYLGCILLVGLPIMIAEVMVGRSTQKSPVSAFKSLNGGFWTSIGWMGTAAAFIILSYYSVVAGWAMHYTWLSASGSLTGMSAEELPKLFGSVYTDGGLNVVWHVVFMVLAISVVLGGVKNGIERWARILMPALLVIFLILLGQSVTMDGFGKAASFVFGPDASKLSAAGVLEAMGHSFFTLSLGMGAMLTYGSYLSKEEDLVGASVAISVLDTMVALLACMVLFPITFTFGMEAAAGPGLVFTNIPIAFSQMSGGLFLSTIFFALLVFAALTSAMSLLEVAASYFIDEKGWSRKKATLVTGGSILLLGIPSALSGSTELFGKNIEAIFGKNWFDSFDYLASNWMLPLGGLGIALFASWKMPDALRRSEFETSSRFGGMYMAWLTLLKYLVPVGVGLVFLNAVGFFKLFGE